MYRWCGVDVGKRMFFERGGYPGGTFPVSASSLVVGSREQRMPLFPAPPVIAFAIALAMAFACDLVFDRQEDFRFFAMVRHVQGMW